MRFEFDENGYVRCILYGCSTGSCCEYTGLVPNEPEEYADMDDWADRAQTQAYYLNDQGNLIYDADKAALLPDEDTVVECSLEQFEQLGYKWPVQRMIDTGAGLATFQYGSVYFETEGINPQYCAWFAGSTWEQIECGLPGIYAWKRIG